MAKNEVNMDSLNIVRSTTHYRIWDLTVVSQKAAIFNNTFLGKKKPQMDTGSTRSMIKKSKIKNIRKMLK